MKRKATTKRKMSLKELSRLVPETISVWLTNGEYRVNFRGAKEATAYYTDDPLDALQTARLMDEQFRGGNVVHRLNPPTKQKGLLWGSHSRKSAAKDAATLIGIEMYDIRYRHASDSEDYVHDFESNAIMLGMPDGSIRIESTEGKQLWEVRNV